MVKRYDCLKYLASSIDEHAVVATSLSSNARIMVSLRHDGANFYGWNMGLCVPFALGLSVSFPQRKVIALDSDGSLMIDTSSLITVADVNPPNLMILVLDNESYARMGPTATARKADLEKIAQGAGIKKTGTLRSLEELGAVKQALVDSGPSFFVVKVEAETEQIKCDHRRTYSRAMKEHFVDTVLQYPDYGGKKGDVTSPGGKAF